MAERYTSTGQVPKGPGISYRCETCDTLIPSVPEDSIKCQCGNIGIDKDAWRLWVRDFACFRVERRRRKR